MSLAPGTRIGPYEILSLLGTGGMGAVYEAKDTRLGRHVALKFLPDDPNVSQDAVDRFEREAQIASSLNHPNICTIFDIGADGDAAHPRRFIVMERLEGDSLRSRIHGQPLPTDQIIEFGCELADALDAAHAKGIIHRDIKPANVFITKRGHAKLLDFGIAKLGGERHASAAAHADETRAVTDVLTTPGTAIGSVNYMSPEQARGEELDARTDLFSLGIVLYEMATGRQAFSGQTTAVIFDAILNRHPPQPTVANPAVPVELERVILRALEKDRKLRFQSAADMLSELARIRRDTTGRAAITTGVSTAYDTSPVPSGSSPHAASAPVAVAPPSTVGTSSATPSAGRGRMLALAAAVIVVLGAAGGYFWWSAHRAPVITEKDTLLLADFTNTTGDAVFDDALKQAVSVQLQQTPFITLLADQRVQRTLRLMQKGSDQAVTGAVAREVCQRAGAKASVEGSIAPIGSSYVIGLAVHNCETGETLAQQQGQAASKEAVLATLGTVVNDLRQHLGESLASIKKYDVPVSDATTNSLDALRAYGQGNRARATKGDEASIPFFEQAVQLDPNFALAYAKLGVVSTNTGKTEDGKKYALKAYELRDKVSEYERLYILWNHAAKVLEDQSIVKSTLELMTTSYPRDFAARNNFGVFFVGRAEYAKALEQYQAAIDIAPDEPLPLANAMTVLFFLGRMDEGFQMAEKSLALRPNGGVAVTRWIWAARLGDPRAAEFEAVAKPLTPEVQMNMNRAALALWKGRANEYSQVLEEVRAKARADHNDAIIAQVDAGEKISRASLRRGKDLDALRASIGPATPLPLLAQIVVNLADMGEIEPARAAAKRFLAEKKPTPAEVIALALVKAADGKTAEAIGDLDATLKEFPSAFDINYFTAKIREKAGDTKGAEASYRLVIDNANALGLSIAPLASRMALAKLLLARGDEAGAKTQLDAILSQLKDAEPDCVALTEAKELRAKIK